jgi:hypothetical protein
MYRGEVLVEEKQLSSVLKSAELLKVFGLTEVCLALRSRLTNESKPVSGSSAQKRPLISEGVKQTTQQSTDILFSKLSNARFEIRPTSVHSQSPQNSFSNQQQLRTIPSTVSKPTTFVKNVILPTSQIYSRPQTTNTQMLSTTETINIAVQPLTVNLSPENNESLISKSITNLTPNTSATKQSFGTPKPTIQTISPKRITSTTWTPVQHSLSRSLLQSPSTSKVERTPPIEVIIDDETLVTNDQNDDDIDIKPPIFEINESFFDDKGIIDAEIDSKTSKSTLSKASTSVSTLTLNVQLKEEPRSQSRTTIKSRTSSTSSQSLPPPPYRQVQRSSARLLRNNIRPPPSLSPSKSKAKEREEKTKVKKVTKEKPLVGLVKYKKTKTSHDPNSSSGDSPEIECPSCGQKFSDEKNWNEHIASVHLPQT